MRVGVSERSKVAIVSFVLLCGSLLLTAYSARNPWFARVGATAVSELVSPLYSGVDSVVDGSGSIWDRYFILVGVAEKNRMLVAQVERLEADKAAFDEQLKENQRLRDLLELGSVIELKGIAASVIANEPTGWVRAIVVNKGSAHGVLDGMPVVHPRGVVGQVVSVSPNYSRILLMTDHVSGVDAIVQDNRARGVVEGSGSSSCVLNYVAKESPVRVGDVVVTSGMDGVFPKGVVVGSITQIGVENGTLLQNIIVRPAVDFARLEEVLIVTGHQAKRDEDAVMRAPLTQGTKERS